jgi:acetyl/propionyl-CoA carboxylase alpha subunit
MQQAAVDAGRAVAYEGVGTIEFVVAGDECAFLEMNTRLQVEHGVTELVTGLDLVELQLQVAEGAALPFAQSELALSGHAVEVRLCAERPREDYQPTPGVVTHVRWPAGPGLRTDAAVETGSVVSPHYDSLVAKLMAVGPTRDIAVARLERALVHDLELDGLETNREMLAAVLGHEDFGSGDTSTDFLERHAEIPQARVEPFTRARHALAASVLLETLRARAGVVPEVAPSWRNIGQSTHRDEWSDGVENYAVVLRRSRDSLEFAASGAAEISGALHASVALLSETAGLVTLEIEGVSTPYRVRSHGHEVSVNALEGQSSFHLSEPGVDDALSAVAGECRAPLPGSVAKVLVALGDQVEDGTGLVVLEAMKMEHTLRATGRGTVQAIRVDAGAQVDVGQLLVVIEPQP